MTVLGEECEIYSLSQIRFENEVTADRFLIRRILNLIRRFTSEYESHKFSNNFSAINAVCRDKRGVISPADSSPWKVGGE